MTNSFPMCAFVVGLVVAIGCGNPGTRDESASRSEPERAEEVGRTSAGGSGNARSESTQRDAQIGGCLRAAGGAPEPDETDLEDNVIHYGFLRQCTDGRPAILTIDLVEYYEGEQAVREAAKDGETLEPDVDPVVHVRNRNPMLRGLGVKPDANVLAFDCSIPGCAPKRVHLEDLPWDALYRFQLQNGLIVYIELPYSP